METRGCRGVCEVVKEEPQWESGTEDEPSWCNSAASCGVSEAAARAGLYTGHEVKDELVVGPECLQLPDVAYSLGGYHGASLTEHVEEVCDKEKEKDIFSISEGGMERNTHVYGSCKAGFTVKAHLLKHIRGHIHMPASVEQGGNNRNIADSAASQQPVTEGGSEQEPGSERTRSSEQPLLTNCFVKLERISVHKMLMFPGTGSHEAKLTEHYEEVHDMEEEKDIYSMSVVGTEDNTHVCAICKAGFTLKAHLLEHVMEHIHIPESVEQGGSWDVADSEECDLSVVAARDCAAVCLYQCDDCGKAFAQRRSLTRHIRGHEVKPEQAPNTSKRNIPVSIRPGPKPYACGTCGSQFATNSGLFLHKKPYPRKKPLSCSICGIQFGDICEYVNHKRTHISENRYFCKLCNKTFICLDYLKKHTLTTHSSVKPYSCKICGKKFFAPSILKIHTRKHTGAKPYMCEICKKEFAHLNNLRNHKRLHTGEKPYSCKICAKKFTQSSHLWMHKFVHSEVRRYACEICKKEFKRLDEIKLHRRIHTGEKPYSCEVCGKKFRTSGDRKNHTYVHTGAKPHACKICKKKFARLGLLEKHKLVHI